MPAQVDVPLTPDDRADIAVASVLRRLAETMEANRPGALADLDTEFLHDYRVSLRRSRAVLRELRPVLAASGGDEARSWREELRWLQQVTGPSRDLDVYVLDFYGLARRIDERLRPDLAPVLWLLLERREVAHEQMGRVLRSDRATAVASGWREFLERVAATGVAAAAGAVQNRRLDGDPGAHPIGELAGQRIFKLYRRIVKMGRKIEESSPDEALHDLRKTGKELRYMLELFGQPLYDDEVVTPLVRALKALQDTLGDHQDRAVQVEMLQSLRDEVGGRPGGPAALVAMDSLVQRLRDDGRAARADFAERFAAFSARDQRKLVKRTFRA